MYQNEVIQNQLLAILSLKSVQKQRNEIDLEVGEKVEVMELGGQLITFLIKEI